MGTVAWEFASDQLVKLRRRLRAIGSACSAFALVRGGGGGFEASAHVHNEASPPE